MYNYGKMKRDFTYVGDIVEGVLRVLELPPEGTPPTRILNIGNNAPIELPEMIAILEEYLGSKAIVNLLPMQPGDVVETCADTSRIEELTGFTPATDLRTGLRRFVDWYMEFGGGRPHSDKGVF